ncbi:MAG: beta strand repeat-containing protein, partial [Saprospiraceae bacterium]
MKVYLQKITLPLQRTSRLKKAWMVLFGLILSVGAQAQYRVGTCTRVTDTLLIGESSFIVGSSGNFTNRGRVLFSMVTTLTNDGGISEGLNGSCNADYRNPCSNTPGNAGANIFDNTVASTTINGNNPLRMYSATINRNIQLDNEWQIVNGFVFSGGTVTTNRNDLSHFLHFLGGSVSGNNSPPRHVNGYAAWSGSGPFTLPIGNGTKQQPVGVVGNCATVFKAAYFFGNPGAASLPLGAPFAPDSLGASVGRVSQREYWDVNGSDSTSITLHFDTASQLSSLVSKLSEVRIVGWNGRHWVNLGNTDTTGTIASTGTVTSMRIVPDSFRVFTFGSGCLTNNTVSLASSTPTLCLNTALTAITHTTTGATGIGTPTGLPAGVTAAWASDTITISGTPTASGTFNYSIPLTGGCGSVNATGTITVAPVNTTGTASSSPTLCVNTALTAITHSTTVATGIGTATGLPAGVTASWASNAITISGTPTASGTFNYSIPLTGGCGGSVNATGTITVTPDNTVGTASSTPTLCINTALTAITHTTTGATGIGTATGLPAGVTAAWASNTVTISGTPTTSGTFNYSIPLTGGCGSMNATGTIIVNENTVGSASSTPTLCINTALTAITHTTTGATGIGTATGLPAGVTASWASNTITISGTPTASGTFTYSIPLTGGCGSANATGTITVTPDNTVGTASSTPTLCINTTLTAITHTTTGATGIGTATGLPAGVTAAWASNTITISGTPTASGTFTYSISLTGGCGSANATGTITVNENTVGTASSTPTLCINTALTAITYMTTGATGIGTATGLPAGVTA